MIIDLMNGVTGIKFNKEDVGEVLDFIASKRDGKLFPTIRYIPKDDAYAFGKGKQILRDGMTIIYIERKDSFLLTNRDSWIQDYSN